MAVQYKFPSSERAQSAIWPTKETSKAGNRPESRNNHCAKKSRMAHGSRSTLTPCGLAASDIQLSSKDLEDLLHPPCQVRSNLADVSRKIRQNRNA